MSSILSGVGTVFHVARRFGSYQAVAFVLGGVLLFAACAKVVALWHGAVPPILASLAPPVVWLVVSAEAGFGLWLLAHLHPRWTRRVALIVFGGMLLAGTSHALSQHSDCGCFGALQLSPWVVVAFDVTAVGALALASDRAGSPWPHVGTWRVLAVAAALVGASLTSSFAVGTTVLEPRTWVGQPVPILADIAGGQCLTHGSWLVVFYRDNCSHCQELLPRIAALAEQQATLGIPCSVALVEVPAFGSSNHGGTMSGTRSASQACRHCLSLRLSERTLWFVPTPTVLELSEGIVQHVRDPSHPDWPESFVTF